MGGVSGVWKRFCGLVRVMSTLEAQLLEKVSGGSTAAGRIHITDEVFIVDIDQVLFYVSHIQQVQENIKARL
jgi:hypothetical protein